MENSTGNIHLNLEEFLGMCIRNGSGCWIYPHKNVKVYYKGKWVYVVRAIFDSFDMDYKGKVFRLCNNSMCFNPEHFKSLGREERFWEKVDRRSDKECWNWLGYKDNEGYGIFGVGNRNTMPAHRFSYELFFGKLPEYTDRKSEICVLHKCDNPSCVNPGHLFLGTDADNVRDRDSKGRGSRGTIVKGHKLVDEDIRKIIELHGNGCSNKELSVTFNVAAPTISKIVNRKAWKWLN